MWLVNMDEQQRILVGFLRNAGLARQRKVESWQIVDPWSGHELRYRLLIDWNPAAAPHIADMQYHGSHYE